MNTNNLVELDANDLQSKGGCCCHKVSYAAPVYYAPVYYAPAYYGGYGYAYGGGYGYGGYYW